MKNITLREIMSPATVTIDINNKSEEVKKLFEHHHLHHGKPSHEQAPQHGATLAQTALLGAAGIKGQGAITDGRNGAQHLRQLQLRRVPAQLRPMRDMVDRERLHPGQTRHMLLVEPDAGAAILRTGYGRGEGL